MWRKVPVKGVEWHRRCLRLYLHSVYDLWVAQLRIRHAKGDTIIVRDADDQIVYFQHRSDAERFLNDLRERLAAFALSPHPEKTRLIAFGRYAAERQAERGQSKPETFAGMCRSTSRGNISGPCLEGTLPTSRSRQTCACCRPLPR